jgi:hypothetical protein
MNNDFARLVAGFLTEQDSREERRKLRPWVGALLAGMCLAILFVAAKNTYGAEMPPMIYRDSAGNSLTLYQEPCPIGGWFQKWKKALWVWNGKAQEACWSIQRTAEGPMVSTVDSAGDAGSIAPQLFRKEEGV